MSTSTRFHYVKCLGDNTWLAKPANAGVFKKDIRQAAPLTIDEAAILGFTETDPIYKLIPVEEASCPETSSESELAMQLTAVAMALDELNADHLAVHVAVSNIRDEKSAASMRAKLILSFVTQWQAVQKHIKK